ncbi:hypothetical protein ILUMI_03303, partial [Ignelater luminosus]
PEIIRRHGYPIQNYTVTTKDGYVLTLFRIPHGRNASTEQMRSPVLVQHGISVSSMVFVNIGKKSLAFTLSDSGYDVWLGNLRGSQYSNRHLHLSNLDERYWNFSFHENGIYDVPAQLDLITEITQQKVFYIGYSMGATAYYIYNVEYPDKASKTIKASVSMAPIAFLKHIDTPIKHLVPLWSLVKDLTYDITNGAINQRTPEFITNRARQCLPFPNQMQACLILGYFLFGYDGSQEEPELLPVFVMQESDAIGIKTVNHFVQLIETGRFTKYDYGNLNEEVYGMSIPPVYNLSKINVPNYFIRAHKDPLATKKNVYETYMALPEHTRPFDIYLVDYKPFTHGDFIMARDVKKLVYDHIVNFLNSNKNRFL